MRHFMLAAAALLALTAGAEAAALGHGMRFAGGTPTAAAPSAPAAPVAQATPVRTTAEAAR